MYYCLQACMKKGEVEQSQNEDQIGVRYAGATAMLRDLMIQLLEMPTAPEHAVEAIASSWGTWSGPSTPDQIRPLLILLRSKPAATRPLLSQGLMQRCMEMVTSPDPSQQEAAAKIINELLIAHPVATVQDLGNDGFTRFVGEAYNIAGVRGSAQHRLAFRCCEATMRSLAEVHPPYQELTESIFGMTLDALIEDCNSRASHSGNQFYINPEDAIVSSLFAFRGRAAADFQPGRFSVVYGTDAQHRQSGIDAGGLTRDFFSRIPQALMYVSYVVSYVFS